MELVKIFIYHDGISNIMLIVNHEQEEYKFIEDKNTIRIFRTSLNQKGIKNLTYKQAALYLESLCILNYKEI